MEMFFCLSPLFGFCQKRSLAKGHDLELLLWFSSLLITGFHFALNIYLINVKMNKLSFVRYAWHITLNKRGLFSNDSIMTLQFLKEKGED